MTKTGASPAVSEKTLIIACGAIAREILAVSELNHWDHLEVQALPAQFHNRPERIAPAMREKIEANKDKYARIICGYADCGTGGLLDAMLQEYGIERLPGAHCYAFFAGQPDFDALAEEELGTFYLTDYLARQFETLLIKGMGMDKHPELRDMYFANYKRLVYLAQTDDPELREKAQDAARRLGLTYEHRWTGLGPFGGDMKTLMRPQEAKP